MKGEEIISLYREKDKVEKYFDNMKNEIRMKRLRVHRRENMEGRIFISFITTIFYSYLSRKMKESKLNKKSSFF